MRLFEQLVTSAAIGATPTVVDRTWQLVAVVPGSGGVFLYWQRPVEEPPTVREKPAPKPPFPVGPPRKILP